MWKYYGMHLNPFIPSSIHSCWKIIIIITTFHNNNFYYHSAFTGVEKLNDDCRKIHLQRSPYGKTNGTCIWVWRGFNEVWKAGSKYMKAVQSYQKFAPNSQMMKWYLGILWLMKWQQRKQKTNLKKGGTQLKSLKILQEVFLNTPKEEKNINCTGIQ